MSAIAAQLHNDHIKELTAAFLHQSLGYPESYRLSTIAASMLRAWESLSPS
jgi:hypothetical protein